MKVLKKTIFFIILFINPFCFEKPNQICVQGDAEAFAITARASAEAEGMNMKAEAFREYKKAAKVDSC